MTKNKIIWTAEEIMNQSDYMDNRNKQFLAADEVKNIIDEVKSEMKDTYEESHYETIAVVLDLVKQELRLE